jgi:hypothetical protein
LKDLPSGFTFHYVFEFFEGKVRIQPYVTSRPDEGFIFTLCENPKLVAKAMNFELFGSETLEGVTISSLKLPTPPALVIEQKKLKSLAEKYQTIPVEKRFYYPVIPQSLLESESLSLESEITLPKSKKRKKTKVSPGSRKHLGRPRNSSGIDPRQRSLVSFLVAAPAPAAIPASSRVAIADIVCLD